MTLQLKKQEIFLEQKKIKGIKDIVLRSIKNLFEYKKEKENYYKPVIVNNFWNNNYIEYKSNGDKNKILSNVNNFWNNNYIEYKSNIDKN